VAVVTGAARNIGRAVALTLADAGASVAVVYSTDEKNGLETARLVTEAGGKAQAFGIDLENLDSISAGVEAITSELGSPDILVNNAAIRPQIPLTEVTPERWDHVFRVNVRGPFFLTQKLVPAMVERRWGRIINMGGLHGYIGSANRSQVHASKLAVIGMTRGIAFDLAEHGVTANVVVPGRIATKRGALEEYGAQEDASAAAQTVLVKRQGKPQEVADMCLFLASERAGYITGQEFFVTGGSFPMRPSPVRLG
jgi:NAD(P)-dependent dehydrogenase (short-subunit alcohol dehydrogenase family)